MDEFLDNDSLLRYDSGDDIIDADCGGFEENFVNTLLDDYKCSICLLVLRDPQQVSRCGHRFCKSCLQKYIRKDYRFRFKKPCPICRKPVQKSMVFEDVAAKRTISGLLVACKYLKDCSWNGELRAIDNHLKCCPFAEVQCPNIPCQVLPKRKDLFFHQYVDCNYRNISCEYCQENCVYQDLEAHFSVCKRFPLECLNKCGKKKIKRSQMRNHMENNCPLTIRPCEFSDIGCLIEGNKEKLAYHASSSTGIHLNLAVKKIISIEKDSIEKDEILSNMQIKISKMEKQIKYFRRQRNFSFNSSSDYSFDPTSD